MVKKRPAYAKAMVGREKKIEIRLRQNNLYDSYMPYMVKKRPAYAKATVGREKKIEIRFIC